MYDTESGGRHRLRFLQTLMILLSTVRLRHNESAWPTSVLDSFWRVAGGATAVCAGTQCGVCERRFGCLTEAWGKCCVQFFQLNGKRSLPADRKARQTNKHHSKPKKRSTYRRTLFDRLLTPRLHTTRDIAALLAGAHNFKKRFGLCLRYGEVAVAD